MLTSAGQALPLLPALPLLLRNKMQVWKSSLTYEMVENLSIPQIDALIADLNKAVEQICQEYGVE
jgi:hypothetical protein